MKVFGLDFKYTEVVVWRCSSEQGLLKISQCWSFFFYKICSFVKKRLQYRCFSVKFAKSLGASFLQSTSGGCFWKYLINSFFIACENDMNGVIAWYVLALQRIFGFIAFVSFLSISFFFSYFSVDFTTCLGMKVSSSILKTKQWSCS